jgi:arylsulfatase A-like enzyme
MNILLCVIDTLRYDFIRAHGANDRIETPNLDRLAAKSQVFDHVYSASYPTIPHRTDVLTGQYAYHGAGPFHPWMPLRFDVTTLPRLLAEAGYATQLIHDTPHLVNGGHAFDWPFAAWTFVHGAEVDRPWIDDAGLAYLHNWAPDPLFDYLGDDAIQEGARRMALTYARANRHRQQPEDWNAAQVFLKGAQFLRENARRGRDGDRAPFLLWLDCFDPHEPWDVPPEFVLRYDDTPGYDGRIDPRAFTHGARHAEDGQFPPGVRERQRALYAAKVTWVDHWFGHVLDALEETGLDEDTAIILTADHGTNLGERGGFGKTWIVNEQEAHVPLLVHVPGGTPGRDDRVVQPQDIFATVLDVADVAPPEGALPSDLQSLLSDAPTRDLALAGRSVDSWQDDPAHIVFTVFGPDGYLNVTADPEASRLFRYGAVEDVAADHPEETAQLREAGLALAERRGLAPQLLAWLRSEGAEPFPEGCTAWPGPPNWSVYWSRLHTSEVG